MTDEEKELFKSLCERYDMSDYSQWPKAYQIAFDLSWLFWFIKKLDADLVATRETLRIEREDRPIRDSRRGG